MKIKFNWGLGIASVYILFLIGSLVMAVIFMSQDVSLETTDYYAKGIVYQEQIDKMNRTKSLPEQLEIIASDGVLLFSFPKIFRHNEIDGTIHFYRPSNSSKDFTIAIAPDTARVQSIGTTNLEKGLWKIKIDWDADGNLYFNEKIVMIN